MIYIACPEKYATGGTELLHQLFYELRKETFNVRMYYFNFSGTGNPINDRFEKYKVEYVCEIEDDDKNILIVPEVATELIKRYVSINKSIWWLSVDNYYKSRGKEKKRIRSILNIWTLLKKGVYFNKVVNFKNKSILHLCQSHYSYVFLEHKGVKNIKYLSDYIGSNFLAVKAKYNDSGRENIVLYNPQKGIDFTKKIIDFDKSISFVPLLNMTQEEIIELCKKSKIYIDFGNHPGKDRFPREAAHLGCIIITGTKGAAKYYEDVRIPEKYKFFDRNKNIKTIVLEIKNSFINYNKVIDDFANYRLMIENEEEVFKKNVKTLWNTYFEKYSC